MKLSTAALEVIAARLAAVPAPPWGEFCESGDWWIQQKDDEGSPVGESICNSGTEDMTSEVSTFFEHAPADVAALLADLRELRKTLTLMLDGGMELPASVFREVRSWRYED